jgi:hypothetical protein
MTDFVAKASAVQEAWTRSTGSQPPSKDAVAITVAQADFETRDGDAWSQCFNWGAVDLRAITAPEALAISNGALKDGDWLYPDGSHSSVRKPGAIGQLHTDTHPGSDGAEKYHTWFAAFDDDVAGAQHFLEVVFRMIGDFDWTGARNLMVHDYATRLYLHGYFEGEVPGARPYAARKLPLTNPEAANVTNYARSITECLVGIDKALTAWELPVTTPPPVADFVPPEVDQPTPPEDLPA